MYEVGNVQRNICLVDPTSQGRSDDPRTSSRVYQQKSSKINIFVFHSNNCTISSLLSRLEILKKNYRDFWQMLILFLHFLPQCS